MFKVDVTPVCQGTALLLILSILTLSTLPLSIALRCVLYPDPRRAAFLLLLLLRWPAPFLPAATW